MAPTGKVRSNTGVVGRRRERRPMGRPAVLPCRWPPESMVQFLRVTSIRISPASSVRISMAGVASLSGGAR